MLELAKLRHLARNLGVAMQGQDSGTMSTQHKRFCVVVERGKEEPPNRPAIDQTIQLNAVPIHNARVRENVCCTRERVA